MSDDQITFRFDPVSDEPFEPAGARQGWIVWRSDETGEAFAATAVQLTDGEGGGSIVQTALPEPVTITES